MNRTSLYLISLSSYLLYLPFVFWFIEVAQNNLTMMTTGAYGWHYPPSPYGYFYFKSLISWSICVVVFWSLHFLVFMPAKFSFMKSMLTTTIIGWSSEWLLGYSSPMVFGHEMQIWPESHLAYVSYGAIGWWFMNSVIFYFMALVLPKYLAAVFIDHEIKNGRCPERLNHHFNFSVEAGAPAGMAQGSCE